MFYKYTFSVKCKVAVKTFVNLDFASVGNKISWYTEINFSFSFVTFSTLNQVHKKLILLVLNANKSLNDCWIVYRCQLINFLGLIFQFLKPIKLPICFFYLLNVRPYKSTNFCVKNLTSQSVFYRICQLVDDKIQSYIFGFFYLMNLRKVLIKCSLKFKGCP